jgi:hypothetical protein
MCAWSEEKGIRKYKCDRQAVNALNLSPFGRLNVVYVQIVFGYAVPVCGINFYSIHARDLPQKEGFGRGGIKYFCFLPQEEAV